MVYGRWKYDSAILLKSLQDVCVSGGDLHPWVSCIPEGLDAKHQLVCVHEQSNRGDPFSVAIRKVAETRHVACMMSCICSFFLRQFYSLACEITRNRR